MTPEEKVFDFELERLSRESAKELAAFDEMPPGSIFPYLEMDGDVRIYGWLLKVTATLKKEVDIRLKPGEEFEPVKASKMMYRTFIHNLCETIQGNE